MVKKISEKEFQEVLSAPAAVVDFSATWCGPCKMLAPVIHEISDELDGQVQFFNVDVDDDSDLAMQFNIQSVPTVIAFKNGEAVAQTLGFQPKPVIKNWITSAVE